MPFVTIANVRHYYRLDGRDDRPVVMLSHSLGQDHSMWDPQAGDLGNHFRVLRYDTRGHGASDVTPGDYSVELLGRDALGIAGALGIEQFAFCGLSLGGMIGQWLALNAPERMSALVLANTSPRPDAQGMETRRRTVLESGMAAVEQTVMGRFFSPRLLAENAPVVAASRRVLRATDPVGYAGACAAVRDTDTTAQLAGIKSPTLVISGDLDVSLPWKGHSDVLAASIPEARVVHLKTAHLSNLEMPRSFSAALHAFLPTEPIDVRESGMHVRRAGTRRRVRRQSARVSGDDSCISGFHHAVRVGHHLDSARPRRPHAKVARPRDDGGDGTMGGVQAARAHRPGARTGMVRSRGSAAPGGRLRRCTGR